MTRTRPRVIRASYLMGPGKHPGVYQNVLMALFLIIEPHEDIRRLYAAVVRGLGHEVALLNGLPSADPHVVLVEPAHAESLEAALRLQRENPGLPIVCASIDGPNHEVLALR